MVVNVITLSPYYYIIMGLRDLLLSTANQLLIVPIVSTLNIMLIQ